MGSISGFAEFHGSDDSMQPSWQGPIESILYEVEEIREVLLNLEQPVFVVRHQGRIGITNQGCLAASAKEGDGIDLLSSLAPLPASRFGSPEFISTYGLKSAYMAGAMANGIASVDMVAQLGRAGYLGSFGAAGMAPEKNEVLIQEIKEKINGAPYAVNLIHNPNEPALERKMVELFLKNGVINVEASAFLDITPNVVLYRAAGLVRDRSGKIAYKNRLIAKLSRKEVAAKFMQPAPSDMLDHLVAEGSLTVEQAELARRVPLADDITAEADSGGHTDNRPMVALLPSMIAVRNEIQAKLGYDRLIRVGVGGGISTPHAALGAFMMGADYIVTGSVNQACVEAGASEHTRKLLAQADMADVIMAPSADMFEMGVKVQVLKRGTMFPMRAQKLYEYYQRYNSLEEIPLVEAEKLQKQIFQRSFDEIWADTVQFFMQRDPSQVEKANQNPKRKMALVFRWYLGLSSRWSNSGVKGREMDYQIWCGPSMGAFNEWVPGTYLELPENRRVVDVARHILTGCAYLYRIQNLALDGVRLSPQLAFYRPEKPLG